MQAQSDEAPLVITEVLVNGGQGGRDASFEWVELQNRSDRTLSLAGWTLEGNHGADPLPALNLSPGQFLLVIANADVAAVFPGGRPDGSALAVIEDGRIGNGLANSGDLVSLLDPAGREVDAVDYSRPPVPLPERGRSIALRLESPGESGNAWVVNAEPSPGRGAVRPVLTGPIDPIAGQETSPSVIREGGDDDGFPAWGLVALAVGIPVLTIGGQYVWKRHWALVPR